MTIKRMAALCLTLVLLLALAACGGSPAQTPASGTDTPAADAPTTDASDSSAAADTTPDAASDGPAALTLPLAEGAELSMWWPVGSNTWMWIKDDYNDMLAYQEMERRTGVHINWQHPNADTAAEQLSLMLVAEDYTDFIWLGETYSYPSGNPAAVADGVFIGLNELIDQYMPNYYDWLYNRGTDEYRRNSSLDDGTIWAFSHVTRDAEPAWRGIFFREDITSAAGLSDPVTLDDWYAVLQAFKAAGIEAPLVPDANGTFTDSEFLTAFGVANGMYQVDGQVQYGFVQEGLRDYLTLMNQWYSEGLLYQEFATPELQFGDFATKVGALASVGYGIGLNRMQLMGFTDEAINLKAVRAPVRQAGDEIHVRQTNSVVRGAAVLTAGCENQALAAQWMDYQYSEEGMLLNNYGIEGVTYDFDENSEPQFTQAFLDECEGQNAQGVQSRYNRQGDGPGWVEYAMRYKYPPEITWDCAQQCQIWQQDDDSWVISPFVTMTADESAAYASIMSNIDTYVNESLPKFIMGVRPLDEFDSYVKDIWAMGLQNAIDLQQAALNRYNAR